MSKISDIMITSELVGLLYQKKQAISKKTGTKTSDNRSRVLVLNDMGGSTFRKKGTRDMQKQLKNKLEKMEKEQLLEIIDSLCCSKDTERMLKLILAPTKSEADRAVQRFSRCAESFVCNSCSAKDYDRMIDAMGPIYTLLKYADSKLSAYTIFAVYQVAKENDLFCYDCYDFLFGLQEDLHYILEHDSSVFFEEERMRYNSDIEE